MNALLTHFPKMPIVDGLTSAKMIRSFEKSHPSFLLSTRAALNGRVPIIAVSASLVEKERQQYMDAGFDGWILKPVSFPRLSDIMHGIVDKQARKDNVYASGRWEKGGWFKETQADVYAANTNPTNRIPGSNPSDNVKRVVREENERHEYIPGPQAVKEGIIDDGDRVTGSQKSGEDKTGSIIAV